MGNDRTSSESDLDGRPDNLIFVGDGFLGVVNPLSGRYQVKIKNFNDCRSVKFLRENIILISTPQSILWFDCEKNTKIWKSDYFPHCLDFIDVLDETESVYVVSGNSTSLYCLKDKTVVWSYPFDGNVRGLTKIKSETFAICRDKRIDFLDTRKQKLFHTIQNDSVSSSINEGFSTPSFSTIMVGLHDHIGFFDVRSKENVGKSCTLFGSCYSLQVDQECNKFIVGDESGYVSIFDFRKIHQTQFIFRAHGNLRDDPSHGFYDKCRINDIKVDNRFIVTCSKNCLVNVWKKELVYNQHDENIENDDEMMIFDFNKYEKKRHKLISRSLKEAKVHIRSLDFMKRSKKFDFLRMRSNESDKDLKERIQYIVEKMGSDVSDEELRCSDTISFSYTIQLTLLRKTWFLSKFLFDTY